MRKAYFIRHGESEGNSRSIWQGRYSPLTEKGKRQASFIAERCTKFPVEVVISSTMNRAKETAEIIVSKINKPLETSDLFVERRRPKEQIGRPKNDQKVLEAENAIRANFHIGGFRFSDEENFDDLRNRAKQALNFLKNRPEENILVVTHGFFMRIVMAYVVLGDKLTGGECGQFIRAFHMENTGITVLGLDERTKDNPWWLWIWNDHAHLG